MAVINLSGKTAGALTGAGLGAGGAYALAPDATVVTLHVLAWEALPADVLVAATHLITAGWSAAIMVAVAVVGHVFSPPKKKEIATNAKVVPGA